MLEWFQFVKTRREISILNKILNTTKNLFKLLLFPLRLVINKNFLIRLLLLLSKPEKVGYISDQQSKNTNISNGTYQLIIGLFDGNYQVHNPAFRSHIFRNSDEIPNNRIDDDDNGYVDDVYGAKFYGKMPDARGDYKLLGINDQTAYKIWRGDHSITMTTALAKTRNPNIKILPMEVELDDENGLSQITNEGFAYAKKMKAEILVIPISFVYENLNTYQKEFLLKTWKKKQTLILNEIIKYPGLIVISAGNQGKNVNSGQHFSFLAPLEAPNLLVVGEVNDDGHIQKESNYGSSVNIYVKTELILTAICPPKNFWTSVIDSIFGQSNYCKILMAVNLLSSNYHRGTSVASAQTARLAAELKSLRPELTPYEIKDIIIETADKKSPESPPILNEAAAIEKVKAMNNENLSYLSVKG